MRRFAIVAGLFLFGVSWAAPASAGPRVVAAKDFFFSPTPIRAPQGITVEWSNEGNFDHTATQDDSLDLWDTGTIAPGSTADVTLASAGTFLYHCKFHGGNGGQGMSGVVKIPTKVSPSSGKVGTTFTVTVSTANAPTGFVFDVQRKVGSGSWARWKRGVTSGSLTSRPSSASTYAFRSRVRRTSNGGASKFSPPAQITVTAA